MFCNPGKDTIDKIKNLHLTLTERPQPELLIALANVSPDVDYEIKISTKEFTSVCPLSLSQPDYATITIKYRPNADCVELKSLKLFFVSFRNVAIFHEMVPAYILKELVKLLSPNWMKVTGTFTTRGGLDTTVEAEYFEEARE